MSNEVERSSPSLSGELRAAHSEPLTVESGLEALKSSPEFHGAVEPLDGLDGFETCEHIALFHKSHEEQLATVVPFVRQGIARGERVMYVLDELSEADAIEALRGGDVDVDAAAESGALTFHTLEETYLRNGYFDPDDMLALYSDALDEATAEYPALRVTASTNWLLDDRATIGRFMEYESRVNDLFHGEDCIALCHYDCTTLPPEILVDVIRTHPHLIYENTVCHNFYYTPPEEFFEPDEPMRDVERMLGTLVDRTRARVKLTETIEELEESNERLRRFAYIASHDLQEPLRMISTYLQLLEDQSAATLDEEAQEYIDIAVDGANRMREMVNGLLAYSRIDMHDADFGPVECTTVLNDVITDLQVQLDESDTTIVCDGLPTVVGDANQLKQVFSNLVSNAIKYSGEDPPHVEIAAERQGDRHVFSVADTGIGIAPEYTDQIFELFNRLHSNETYQGTGIGLALCRKIISNHGGDIWVDSELGEGTTFYFTLPGAK